MYFITNFHINEASGWSSSVAEPTRTITLNHDFPDPRNEILFCKREAESNYHQISSHEFFQNLKGDLNQQVLLYIHGFNNSPEEDVFKRAENLQDLYNERLKDSEQSVEVIVILWPCDQKKNIIKKYWDDQDAAKASRIALTRMLGFFMDWREENRQTDAPCYRPINILSHSMGNRVLRFALSDWFKEYGNLPALFRNIFMVAADVPNECLEKGQMGYEITQCARNVSVYYANDDTAMSASKIANVKNKIFSRRLGHTGPEDLERTEKNVFAIDCDDVNNLYDFPKGHSYFLFNGLKTKKAGAVFDHIFKTTVTGRVKCDMTTRSHVIKIP